MQRLYGTQRLTGGFAAVMRRGFRQFVDAHMYACAISVGVITYILQWLLFGDPYPTLKPYPLYVICLLTLCFPFRDYGRTFKTAFTSGATLTLINTIVFTIFLVVNDWQVAPAMGLSMLHIIVIAAVMLAFTGLAPALLISAIIFIRRRYWADHKPGFCRVCRYSLQGLTTQRCPECGTPFDLTELTPQPDASHD